MQFILWILLLYIKCVEKIENGEIYTLLIIYAARRNNSVIYGT